MKYKWSYGESEYQKYYEAKVDGDHLIVFANNWNPDVWLASVRNTPIFDKTYNDRQRKKSGKKYIYELPSTRLLSSARPEYMMNKAEKCYRQNKTEITP